MDRKRRREVEIFLTLRGSFLEGIELGKGGYDK